MPSSAIINDKIVIGPAISQKEWIKLRRQHKKGLPVKMRCCGAPGHLRNSKNGVQHFYHAKKGICNWKPETTEHLILKDKIYKICSNEGWDTQIEYPSKDHNWISDIFAEKGDRRVVFEVQISNLPLNVLKDRNKKYVDEGIDAYWLLNNYLGKSDVLQAEFSNFFNKEDINPKYPIKIDNSIFLANCEIEFFFLKKIQTIGLNVQEMSLYTNDKTKVPFKKWVKQVLNGDYSNYLKEKVSYYKQKYQLKKQVLKYISQFNEFHWKIIQERNVYRNDLDRYRRNYYGDLAKKQDPRIDKQFADAYLEAKNIEDMYLYLISFNGGLFTKRENARTLKEELFFSLEKRALIKKMNNSALSLINQELVFLSKIEELKTTLDSLFPLHRMGSQDSKDNRKIIVSEKPCFDNTNWVKFFCSIKVNSNWLTDSHGEKYQVVPGLESEMPLASAKEFEQSGFGKIIGS